MSGVVTQNVLGNSGLVKAVEAGGGAWTEIKTLTSGGSDDNLSFVNGTDDVVLDSTYPIYCFQFINIHPETNDTFFEFNGSDDTSSHSYDITKTTTLFTAEHDEGNSVSQVTYQTGDDLAQATGYQRLFNGIGNGNDECLSGTLHLFNPSSTTFVKHFVASIAGLRHNDASANNYCAGYFNTTAAITALDFKMTSGEIQGGKIKLFGIKDS